MQVQPMDKFIKLKATFFKQRKILNKIEKNDDFKFVPTFYIAIINLWYLFVR